LRTPAAEVSGIDADTRRLVDDMLETMYAAPGVGLAAPQIGIPLRVVVFDIGEGPHHLINPVMEETSGSWTYEEGCLSVPERYWPIERPAFARARGLSLDGRDVTYEGDELMGRVLQHELDHIEGTLLLERLPRRARKLALKELREEALGLAGPQ
jgi:peptide deformylase